MNKIFDYSIVDLQLFADGGADGASGAASVTGGEAGDGTTVAGDNQNVAGSDAGEGSAEKTTDRAKLYAQFKNDYKSEYEADMKRAIRGRLKSSNEYKNKVSPMIDMLAAKYGCESTDLEAIQKAMEDDDSYYSKRAMERGMTVSQMKQFDKIERENERYRLADAERQREADNAKAREAFNRQVEECKKTYPNFDAEAEAKDPNFSKLVRIGYDLKSAYEITHRHEIMTAAMQVAAQKSAEQVAASVASNSVRPSENGLGNNTPVVSSIDISKLTREQMEDYKKQARNGAKITFKQ